MPLLMPDNNVQGHLKAMVQFLRSGRWQEFWERAAVTEVSFRGRGLDRDTSDRLIWQFCQSQQIVLFTGNRNQQGPDSLEETIRSLNQLDSLPVITLGDPIRFGLDGAYAEAAAIKLLDYLLYLDDYRGAGRIWVP